VENPTDLRFSEYETRLTRAGVEPNFFVSERYWQAAGWAAKSLDGGTTLHVLDQEGQEMLPPMDPDGPRPAEVWCDFVGYQGLGQAEFLDHQFLYLPSSFLDLSGHQRAVFRRNVRRFDKRNPNWTYRQPRSQDELMGVMGDWLEDGQEVYDLDAIVRYMETCPAAESRVLGVDGEVVAANAWDYNRTFINFRYSFVRRGVKYLSEFVRLQFYLDMMDRWPGRFVNDGGSLGSDRLFRFKSKLGPWRVDQLHTWRKETE